MGYMKYLFNAAFSLTALGNTFDEKVQYNNLSENQELLETIQKIKSRLKDHIEVTQTIQIQITMTKTKAKAKKRMRNLMTIQLIQNS
jgi:hypothetical protein